MPRWRSWCSSGSPWPAWLPVRRRPKSSWLHRLPQQRSRAAFPPLANSLAEAVEADQASAAAHEARQTVVARSQAIAAAFAQTARAIRRTIHLAERIDRAWAHPSHAGDSHPDTREAMARRQITRAVTEAIHRDAAGQRAEDLIDRLDSLDTLDDVTSRPAEDIVHDICRDLGLDVARMPPPTPDDHPVPPGLRTSLRGERRNSHRPQATAPPEAAR